MYDTASTLAIAASQLGYREGKTGARYNNDQKFSDQLPGFAWSDSQPWCATFVQWCLWQTGVKVPEGARSASCATSVNAYRKAGRFTEYPVVGAQIFFGAGGGTHTGLVERYDDTYVYTVEGNTNDTGSPEGNGVYRRRRVRRDAYVYGYGVPYYTGKAVSPDPKWNGRNMAA